MTPATASRILFWAALFNWLVGLGLLLAPNLFLSVSFITPPVGNPHWAGQFGWLVLMFGVGYFWASRDLVQNRQIVRLAIPAKLGVGAVALAHVFAGNVSWQIMIPAGADVAWAVLFVACLRTVPLGIEGSQP